MMKTISEMRKEYELKTGRKVGSYKAYPLIGRGSVVHDWICHADVVRIFDRSVSISIFKKLRWLAGGRA